MAKKVVLIVGAGSTVADVITRSKKSQPPLDKGFFSIAKSTHPGEVRPIISYNKEIYGRDILHSEHDSLERVMASVYTDIFFPSLASKASAVFQGLIRLFNRRLAETTNNIAATQQRYLYRIIARYFEKEIEPSNLTIVTFNQDLQIEKIIHKFGQTKGWVNRWGDANRIFNFPYCYNLHISRGNITFPRGSSLSLFDIGKKTTGGVKILKLHGSLNWYSTHRSPKESPKAMFKHDRDIRITRRQTIDPDMKLTGRRRARHTLPVVVPPLIHKSAVLHQRIKELWTIAENDLKKANEVVVFGYSCSPMDFESCNLIQRSLIANKKYEHISIIDPDANVLAHYGHLIKPRRIHYYSCARDFLENL